MLITATFSSPFLLSSPFCVCPLVKHTASCSSEDAGENFSTIAIHPRPLEIVCCTQKLFLSPLQSQSTTLPFSWRRAPGRNYMRRNPCIHRAAYYTTSRGKIRHSRGGRKSPFPLPSPILGSFPLPFHVSVDSWVPGGGASFPALLVV